MTPVCTFCFCDTELHRYYCYPLEGMLRYCREEGSGEYIKTKLAIALRLTKGYGGSDLISVL